MNKYILEFDSDEIQLIVAITHSVLLKNPDEETARRLISDMVEQASNVYSDPAEHGIGVSPFGNTKYEGKFAKLARTVDYDLLNKFLAEGYYEE